MTPPSLWEKEGESGLLDNFAFTITRAFFGTSDKYMNGERYLITWEGTTDSLDTPMTNIWFSLGKEWISKDGGLTIEHESGNPEKFFVASTQYYKILRRCVDDFGMGKLLESRGTPLEAATWVGLSFQMASEDQNITLKDEDQRKPAPKTMPKAFLGVVSGIGAGAGASSSAVAKAPTAAAASGGETPQQKMARLKAEKAAAATGGGTLRDQVIAALQAHDDFGSAQEAALAIDGVMDDDDLLVELMDEEGLFAEVKANA